MTPSFAVVLLEWQPAAWTWSVASYEDRLSAGTARPEPDQTVYSLRHRHVCMDRRLAAITVTALVLLSGCPVLLGTDDATVTPAPEVSPNGTDGPPLGTESPTPDVTVGTPSPTPESTPTPTPTVTPTPTSGLDPLSTMDLPPGVTESGVDVPTLLAAHRDRLATNASRTRYTIVDSTNANLAVLIRNDSSAILTRADGADAAGFLEVYLSPTELGTRNTTSGEVLYGRGPLPTRELVRPPLVTIRRLPTGYVRSVGWEPVGVTTGDDGRRRAVLEPTRVVPKPAVATTEIAETDDVDGRMLVTSDGRITALRLKFTAERANGSADTHGIDYTNDRYGTASVERPDWLSAPPNLRPSNRVEDYLLAFEHTAGATIPAGTQLNVTSGFSRVGAPTVERAVEPGDTLYVYKTGEGTNETVHVTVGERPTLTANVTAFSGTVTVEGWAGDYQFQSAIDVDASDVNGTR